MCNRTCYISRKYNYVNCELVVVILYMYNTYNLEGQFVFTISSISYIKKGIYLNSIE